MARCPVEYSTCHRETEEKCPTLDDVGNPICTMGLTEIPMVAKNLATVYEIKHRPDGTTELKLSRTHVAYLNFIVEHGGECPCNMKKLPPEVRSHIDRMVAMGVISEMPLIGRDEVMHKITDMGRNVIAQARKAIGIA